MPCMYRSEAMIVFVEFIHSMLMVACWQQISNPVFCFVFCHFRGKNDHSLLA